MHYIETLKQELSGTKAYEQTSEKDVMCKTIFVTNIIIYMCLQHSNVYKFEIAVYLYLRERI